MSTPRDAFLSRVRQAVLQGNHAGVPRELPARNGLGYQGGGPDPVVRFAEELVAVGGHYHEVATLPAAAQQVLQLVQAFGARKAIVAGKGLPEGLGLNELLSKEGIDTWQEPLTAVDPETKRVLFAADVGITGADRLIAETGTIVLTTASGHGRSLSLLPPVHIVVAGRRQVVPDLFDVFAELESTTRPAQRLDLPACVTLITGPSKTGDIELRLVTGVHGPGEVHVVVIDDRRLPSAE